MKKPRSKKLGQAQREGINPQARLAKLPKGSKILEVKTPLKMDGYSLYVVIYDLEGTNRPCGTVSLNELEIIEHAKIYAHIGLDNVIV